VKRVLLAALALLVSCAAHAKAPGGEIRIGSKKFTESVILGELAALLARDAGAPAEHRKELGGTRVLWNALRAGDIDLYPEYTGTITEEILAGSDLRDDAAMRDALARQGVRMSRPLGFNNTYAIGMRKHVAARLGIRRISDLRRHPALRFGFNNEFLDRGDGWPALRRRYALPQRDVRGIDHDVAYKALASGAIDATDLYSTDAEIRAYDLAVLEDDRRLFPAYDAVLLYRADLPARFPRALAAMARLEGAIDAPSMIALNARAKLDHVNEGRVASDFAREHLGVRARAHENGRARRILARTGEHLSLVAVSLGAAILVAVPLGILAARRRRLGQAVLAAAGVIQTIPSLALLVFMIPLLGIGAWPAIVALFLYSLLPILRNTSAGLHDIAPGLRESAEALGLPRAARLRLVELPLASRAILAGIKDVRRAQRGHGDARRADRGGRLRAADPHGDPAR
jgi:osmoprotectant transport system permease protein